METALALCRFLHFLCAMFLFGSGAFVWVCAPPSLGRELAASLRPLTLAAGALLALSVVVWLALEAASMTGDWAGAGDPSALHDVLFGTAFGQVWQARIVVCVALAIALVFAPRGRSALTTGLAALALASLAGVDHAAMQSGATGVLHRANDAVHLLGAGAWLGGLLPFWLCLRTSPASAEAVAAMTKFSTIGHGFVALIVLTGATNIALTTGAIPFPPTTPYRALLTVKIALVAAMIGLALYNRYALAPRLATDARAVARLRATSLLEVGLAVVVVALVSLFGLWDPA